MDKFSIFEDITPIIIQEGTLKLSTMYSELFKEMDKLVDDPNDTLEPQEISAAAGNLQVKKLTAKMIVQHSSEWDKDTHMADTILNILEQHKERLDNYEQLKQHYNNQKTRIEKLEFFSQCTSIEGFPQSDSVYHFNPIMMVAEFGSNGCLTMEKFKQIFPSASEAKRKEVLDVFNKYCKIFEINTPLRIAHFFAQVKEEVGETINYQTENLNYTINALKHGSFKYFRENHAKAELYGRGNGQPANQEAIANRAYANRNGNGDIASGDGWNFRGKGFIQLTGRTNYENANKEIQTKAPNSNIDIIANPESILTVKGAMVSSMAYWTMNRLNTKADNAGWDREKVDNITDTVNSGTPSRENRKENFDLIQNILNK
jgi:putative chitinase